LVSSVSASAETASSGNPSPEAMPVTIKPGRSRTASAAPWWRGRATVGRRRR
jgi:hypothetical protein